MTIYIHKKLDHTIDLYDHGISHVCITFLHFSLLSIQKDLSKQKVMSPSKVVSWRMLFGHKMVGGDVEKQFEMYATLAILIFGNLSDALIWWDPNMWVGNTSYWPFYHMASQCLWDLDWEAKVICLLIISRCFFCFIVNTILFTKIGKRSTTSLSSIQAITLSNVYFEFCFKNLLELVYFQSRVGHVINTSTHDEMYIRMVCDLCGARI